MGRLRADADLVEAFWASKLLSLASIAVGDEALEKLSRSISPRGYAERVAAVVRLSKCLAQGPHKRIFEAAPQQPSIDLYEVISRSVFKRLWRAPGEGERARHLKAVYMLSYPEIWREVSRRSTSEELKKLILGYSTATSVNLLVDLLSEGAEERLRVRGALVLVDARRVLEYIAESRRPRDMMISSLLASMSVWASIRTLASALGPDIILIPFPPASDPIEPLVLNTLAREAVGGAIKLPRGLRAPVGVIAKTPAQMLLLLPSSPGAREIYSSYGGDLAKLGSYLNGDPQGLSKYLDRVKDHIAEEYRRFWDDVAREALGIARRLGVEDEVIRDIVLLRPEPPLPLTISIEIVETSVDAKVEELLTARDGKAADSLCKSLWSALDEKVKKIYEEESQVDKGRPVVSGLAELTRSDYESRRARKICSVCGTLPAVFEWERHGASLKDSAVISEDENLCIYCFIKRMLSTISGVLAIYRASLGSWVEYRLRLHRKIYKAEELERTVVPVAPSVSDIAIQGLRRALVEEVGAEDLKRVSEKLERVLRRREELEERGEIPPLEPQDISFFTRDILRKLRSLERKGLLEGMSKSEYKHLRQFLSKSIEELIEKPMAMEREAGERSIRSMARELSREIQRILLVEKGLSMLEVGKGFSSYYAIVYSDMDDGGKIKKGELVVRHRAQGAATANMIPLDCSGQVREEGEEEGYKIYRICMTPAMIHLYSAALISLAEDAEKIILRSGGWPIYIGGDDVIALANLGSAIRISYELRKSLEGSALLGNIVRRPTRSTSILISHYKNPLYMAFTRARDLLEDAKGSKLLDTVSRRTVKRKDMISISILFRGSAESPLQAVIPHVLENTQDPGGGSIEVLPVLYALIDCTSRGASECLSKSIYRDYRRSLSIIDEIIVEQSGAKDRVVETLAQGLSVLVERNSPPVRRSQLALSIGVYIASALKISKSYVIMTKTGSSSLVSSLLRASEIFLSGLEGWV